jgi:hypothetical protein
MPKPSSVPTWATGESATIEVPTAPQKANGYGYRDKPAHGAWNWMWNLVGQWLEYIDSITPFGRCMGGDGSDGEFHPVTDTVLTTFPKRYASITIPVGVTVTVMGPNSGQDIAYIYCQGDADIQGTLTTTGGGLPGGAGGAGAASSGVPGGNGSAGTGDSNPIYAGERTGGGGGLGANGSFEAAYGLAGGAGAGVTDGADGPADAGPYNPRAAADGGIAGTNLCRLPFPQLFPGTGGGGGSGGSNWASQHGNDGGAGGTGGAALYLEAGGNVTNTGTISVAGEAGHPAGTAYPGIAGAPGGAGGGGQALIRCASFTNTGTLTEGTGKILVQEY